MKITEGEQGRFGPRSLKLSLSLSLSLFGVALSPLGSPDLVGASSQRTLRITIDRIVGGLNPVEGEKQAAARFGENGSVACGNRKKRERERERRDRLYARLKHEDASREYCAPSPCTWRGIKAK